jgi:hypothetical protein
MAALHIKRFPHAKKMMMEMITDRVRCAVTELL